MGLLSRLARSASNNGTLRRISLAARDARRKAAIRDFSNINAFERRVYSQNGEDGIIGELFARIPGRKLFVEIGVEDGLQCNAALLSRHYGWKGVMVEADAECFRKLQRNYSTFSNVTCLRLLVDRENISPALSSLGIPKQLDLLCIDIDGNDYYVWDALKDYRASVVVIEYNATFGPEVSRTIAYDPSHFWQRTRYYGASLKALQRLGERLGYALLATDRRGINAFFVRRDLLATCGFPERTARQAWRPNRLGSLLPRGGGELVDPDAG